jgi:hypothetical protein
MFLLMGYKSMAPPYAVRSDSRLFKAASTILFSFPFSVGDEVPTLLPHMMQQRQVRVLALHFAPFVHGAWAWL